MKNSEKFLKLMSDLLENGILTSQDAKNELINNLKFKRDNIVEKLELVSREEFEILKKLTQKQEITIKNLLKKKKTKKAKKS